jgi:2-oxo-3-hexenedioate decarboxylase
MHADHRPAPDIEAIAAEASAAIEAGRQVGPFSARASGLTVEDAYRVTAAMRARSEAQGRRPVGRKIGFTNRTIWDEFGVRAPIWGYVYEDTLKDLREGRGSFAVSGLVEPRIEPEIVFGLRTAPRPEMDDAALLGCIEWVAHGFEIVQSIFPGWQFAAADTIAANGVHGALLVGPRQPVAGREEEWRNTLASFEIDLLRNNELADRGRAENVLDGPLSALRHLVALLDEDPLNPPLTAGEIVTTGTLTRALPVRPGDTWTTRLTGITLAGLSLTLS